MVDYIDIHTLTHEELSGVADLYPWYAAARLELLRRMSEAGQASNSQIAQTALHLASRRVAARLAAKAESSDCSDKDAQSVVGTVRKKQVYVVGGDYFSQEQYNAAQHSDDGVFSKFVNSEKTNLPPLPPLSEHGDFCTETLAQIYLEQDYKDEAIEIYSKLSLRYPEKSVYFATLIDEIKQKLT